MGDAFSMLCPRCWGTKLQPQTGVSRSLRVREPCGLCKGAGHVPDRQLTEHFRLSELLRSETAVRQGLSNEPEAELAEDLVELAELLERVRQLLGVPCRVSSGYRAPLVNRAIGSNDKSAHPWCRAVDFVPQGVALGAAMERILSSSLRYDQLIFEFGHWIHLGSRKPRTGEQRRQNLMVFKPGAYEAFDATDARVRVMP